MYQNNTLGADVVVLTKSTTNVVHGLSHTLVSIGIVNWFNMILFKTTTTFMGVIGQIIHLIFKKKENIYVLMNGRYNLLGLIMKHNPDLQKVQV